MTIPQRLRAWWLKWNDLPWGLAAIVGTICAYYMIKRLDPRAGLDGFAVMFTWGLGISKGAIITFSAWWAKHRYTVDLSREEEIMMLDRATRGEGIWVLAIDRLEWAMWLFFWYAVLSY